MWNPSTGQIECELEKANVTMSSLAFSHDGSHIIFGGDDGEVWIWNLITNESTLVPGRIQLSDRTLVLVYPSSSCGGQFHHFQIFYGNFTGST